ncbi:MAG: hypothetical protein ACOYB2_19790, partial [Limnohabitans sp.]
MHANLSRFFVFLTFSAVSVSALHPPVHHVLFDEVGQMASSMTYIHVAIPLNITTFQHQIDLFHTYLTNFKALTTNESHQVIFTKTIRDLARFATDRLDILKDRLTYIDHVLPGLTDNIPTRQKRFLFLPAAIKWQNKYNECKRDYETRMRLYLRTTQDLRFEWNKCEEKLNKTTFYPDIPEFHAVYQDPSAPTTTPAPSPPPDFSAFRNKTRYYRTAFSHKPDQPLTHSEIMDLFDWYLDNADFPENITDFNTQFYPISYDNTTDFDDEFSLNLTNIDNLDKYLSPVINETDNELDFASYAQNIFTAFKIIKTINQNSTAPQIQSRRKRFVLAAAALFTGVLGTFFGLYNTHEISRINTNVINLQEQQHLLTQIVQRHEHEFQELTKDLDHLTSIVRTLIMYNPALVFAKLEYNIKIIEDRLDVLFDSLQQLQHHRLSVKLLDSNQMQALHSAILTSARSRNLQLIPKQPSHYFQLDVSYIRTNNEVTILLHVPCVTNNQLLTIYRYIPFPYPVSHSRFPSFLG